MNAMNAMITNTDTIVSIESDDECLNNDRSQAIPEISHSNSPRRLQKANSKIEIAHNTDDESILSSDTGSAASGRNSRRSNQIFRPKIISKATTKKKKNKFWKKPSDKPKRPLSSYNIFFKHARSRIIHGKTLDNESSPQEVTKAAIEAIVANSTQPRTPRSNRKTHGRIGFGDLARTIANQWKALNSQQRAIYDHCASIDMKRYRNEVSVWKAKKERQALVASTGNPTSHQRESAHGDGCSFPIQSIENDTNQWSTVQHRALDSSFSSADSEETDSSLDQEFVTISSQDGTGRTFPSVYSKISSQVGDAHENCIQTVPSFFESSSYPGDYRTHDEGISSSVAIMEKLRLEEEIQSHQSEIHIREKHLAAMNAWIDYHNSLSKPPRGCSSLFSSGPSIERMQQLHLHRLHKGNKLKPLIGMNRINNTSSGIIDIVNNSFNISSDTIANTNDEYIDIDPVPLDEIFTPSVFDAY